MTSVKINNILYPATIVGRNEDREWDNRESKTITLEMDYATAVGLFVDGLAWSIVCEEEVINPDTGKPVTTAVEYDNSEYCVAGTITDNRDGTMSVKMGKRTDKEMLEELLGVLNND